MFHLADNSKLRGAGYKVLNVLRACNIVSLLLLAVASWVMVVMTGINGQFFFFDAIAHVFISSMAMFLLLTEVQFGLLARYFARSWPIFSQTDGFLWLGLAMIAMGCDMLGNLNKTAFSVDSLGLPLWRLILAAGILALTFGFANLVATLIFRDGPAGLTARMIRADGNLADGGKLGGGISSADMHDYYSTRSNSLKRCHTTAVKEDESGYMAPAPAVAADDEASVHGFGGVAANRLKRMTQAFRSPFASTGPKKMQISNPIPLGGADTYDADVEHQAPDVYGEDRASPILPQVRRPPTALHPANRRLSSQYSVANMERF